MEEMQQLIGKTANGSFWKLEGVARGPSRGVRGFLGAASLQRKVPLSLGLGRSRDWPQ